MWITEAPRDPVLGSVYGFLPDYWADEVALFSDAAQPMSHDIVGFGGAGVYVALSNGDGSFQPIQRVIDNFAYDAGGWRVDRHPRFLADITGDGILR
jgi:hypothetical protein